MSKLSSWSEEVPASGVVFPGGPESTAGVQFADETEKQTRKKMSSGSINTETRVGNPLLIDEKMI